MFILKNLFQIRLKLLLKRPIQKAAEATGDLIGDKIAGKITKVLKSSLKNISEKVINEHDKEIPKERYMYPEEKQEIIDKLRLE